MPYGDDEFETDWDREQRRLRERLDAIDRDLQVAFDEIQRIGVVSQQALVEANAAKSNSALACIFSFLGLVAVIFLIFTR